MLASIFSDHTFQVVFLGSGMIGAVSGALGCFAYLRRQSLIGDVVSHSSLLGIVIAFWLGSYLVRDSRSLTVLMPGAIIAGVAALFLTKLIIGRTRIKQDTGLGLMLAIFFGTGMMLLRWLQRATNIPGRSGLSEYLFGMAAAMTTSDLRMIAGLGTAAVLTMLLAWNRLKVLTFDAEYSAGLGLRVRGIEGILLTLLVIAVVIGLQVVGVVLTISLLITPAAASRQWTGHLGPMVALASVIGALCAGAGAIISASGDHMPTGPVIVILLTAVFMASLVFAPRRGLLSRKFRSVN